MVDRIIIFYGSRRDFEEIVEQETEDFEEVIPFMELIQHYNARLRKKRSVKVRQMDIIILKKIIQLCILKNIK